MAFSIQKTPAGPSMQPMTLNTGGNPMTGNVGGDQPAAAPKPGTNPTTGYDPNYNWQHQVTGNGIAQDFLAAGNYNLQGQDQVNGTIQNGFGRLGTSPLAGVTSLGQVANSGVVNAGGTNINTAGSNAITAAQLNNINTLNRQAQGQGPSLAEEQAKRQGEANIAATMAMAGSQRGAGNSALGLRNAGMAKAAADQQAIQAGVQGRTAEEIAAQQQLTGALQGTQGQVMQGAQAQAALEQQTNLANAQAGNTVNAANSAAQNAAMLQQGSMQQQTQLANLQAMLQNKQIDNNQYNSMLQAMMTEDQNATIARTNAANAAIGENTSLYGINKGVDVQNNANALNLMGAGLNAGGTIIGGALSVPSDINLKTNIKSGDKSIKDFLNQIGSNKNTQFNLWSK